MQQAHDDTGPGLVADQAVRRLHPWSPRLCPGATTTSISQPIWLDSLAGRLHLAADVMQQMQLQLDAAWRVQQLEHRDLGRKDSLRISHPSLPGCTFKSRSEVLAFLQAQQQQGRPLPGVLDLIPNYVLKHTYGDPAAAPASPAATAAAAAAGLTGQQQQGPRGHKRTLGSDSAHTGSKAAVANDKPSSDQQRQTRQRSRQLVAGAVQCKQGRITAVPAAARTSLTDPAGSMESQQQPSKRARVTRAVGADGQQASSSSHAAACSWKLPDGRTPCPIARAALQQQIAGLVTDAVLDDDWVVYAGSKTPPRCDPCILHPSFPDGYFRSSKSLVSYLRELIKRLGPGVAVPGFVQQQQQAAAPSPAVRLAIQASLPAARSGYRLLPKKPVMLAASGDRGSCQVAAAAAVQPPPSPVPLNVQAAAAAAAGAGEQNCKGSQVQLPASNKPELPANAQHQQGGNGSRRSQPNSSAGSHTSAAAAAEEEMQLPDGRKPCAKTLALVKERLSARLPGILLDDKWLVYAAQQLPPKLDICIKHPCLPVGYFRSLRSFLQYMQALNPLIARLGPHVAVPGCIHVTQPQRKPLLQANGMQDKSVTLAVAQALQACPGGFVWRGPGSSFKQKAALKLKQDQQQPQQKQKQDQKQQQPQQKQDQQQPQQKRKQDSSGSRASAEAAAAAAKQKSRTAGGTAGHSGRGCGGSACANNNLGGQLDGLPGSLQREIMTWRHPPIDREYEFPRKGAVLVLGMIFASATVAGQAHDGMAHYRDRVRLLQLKSGLGYRPHSFNKDDKDEDAHKKLHVQGNFNSMRGAVEVVNRFPGVKFNAIFCDYFRFPSGYASSAYKPQLFTQFVPELIRRGAADPGVQIYIPNNEELLKQLAAAGAFTGYAEVVALPGECYPLYKATELAQASGQLQGAYSNASEARQLPQGSEFVVMRCFADAPVGGSALPRKSK